MRELPVIDRVRRILNSAGMDNWGDGYTVTDVVTGYAEPGYGPDNTIIVLGNWNPKRFPRNDDSPLTKAENLGPRLASILETAGADVEWSDEWVRCGDCYRIFRSSPDSYSWSMYGAYVENACDYFCADCLTSDPESLIEDYVNNPDRCLTFFVDLESIGFEQYNDDPYESGFHVGMDDNPKTILESIHNETSNAEVVFVLTEQSQFYIRFSTYVRYPSN